MALKNFLVLYPTILPLVIFFICLVFAVLIYHIAGKNKTGLSLSPYSEQILLSRIIAICAIISTAYTIFAPEAALAIATFLVILSIIAIIRINASWFKRAKDRKKNRIGRSTTKYARWLIADGKTKQALDFLLTKVNGKLGDQIVLLRGEFVRNEDSWKSGVLSLKEFNIEINGLNNRILEILED